MDLCQIEALVMVNKCVKFNKICFYSTVVMENVEISAETANLH